MSIRNDLERMCSSWKRLGIVERFPDVQHFSSDKFITGRRPGNLEGFYKH